MIHQIPVKQTKAMQEYKNHLQLADAIRKGEFNFGDKIKVWFNIYTIKHADEEVILYTCGHDTIIILPQHKMMKYGDMFTCNL